MPAEQLVVPSPPVLPEHRSRSDALFREHAPFVWRVLRRLGVPDADIDDVCQDVFIAVHQQLPSFEGRCKMSTWIYAIARRRVATYRSRAFRRREQLTDAPPEPLRLPAPPEAPAAQAEADVSQVQLRNVLDRLLDTLDDAKREVFVLYEIEELDMREVVEIVGCPLQTGYSRLHAAREQLRRAAREAGVMP